MDTPITDMELHELQEQHQQLAYLVTRGDREDLADDLAEVEDEISRRRLAKEREQAAELEAERREEERQRVKARRAERERRARQREAAEEAVELGDELGEAIAVVRDHVAAYTAAMGRAGFHRRRLVEDFIAMALGPLTDLPKPRSGSAVRNHNGDLSAATREIFRNRLGLFKDDDADEDPDDLPLQEVGENVEHEEVIENALREPETA